MMSGTSGGVAGALAAGTGAAFAFGGACRAMLLCGAISMSAGSFFALFEQAGSDAVSSWPLN